MRGLLTQGKWGDGGEEGRHNSFTKRRGGGVVVVLGGTEGFWALAQKSSKLLRAALCGAVEQLELVLPEYAAW